MPILLVAILLFAMVYFSIGFILNMIVRKWWASIAGALLMIILVLISRHSSLTALDWVFYILFPVVFGVLSGRTYQSLRRQGYRLFQ